MSYRVILNLKFMTDRDRAGSLSRDRRKARQVGRHRRPIGPARAMPSANARLARDKAFAGPFAPGIARRAPLLLGPERLVAGAAGPAQVLELGADGGEVAAFGDLGQLGTLDLQVLCRRLELGQVVPKLGQRTGPRIVVLAGTLREQARQ